MMSKTAFKFKLYLKLATILIIGSFLTSFSAKAEFNWMQHSGESITVMMPEHPVTVGVRNVIEKFQLETGIRVVLNTMSESMYYKRMEDALMSDNGKSKMDVYFLPMDSTAYSHHTKGLLHSLQSFIDNPNLTHPDYDIADFPKGFLDSTKYNIGGNWEYHGIPASFETYIMFYNKAHVNEYLGGKVPQTMDELINAAMKIKEHSNGTVVGTSLRGIKSETLIDTVTGIVNSSIGDDTRIAPYNVWFDGSWERPNLVNEKIKRGLNNYAKLMKSGPDNIQQMDWPDASAFFMAGGATFFIDASLFGPSFENEENSTIAGNLGYSIIPIDNDQGDPYTAHWLWGYGIPKNANNAEAAWLFIQYISNKENESIIGKLHGGAPRLSTWKNVDYASTFNPEYVDTVFKAMPNSQSSVVQKNDWGEYAERIIGIIHDIYEGDSPEAATLDGQADFIKMNMKNKS